MSINEIRDEEGDKLKLDKTTGAIAIESDMHSMTHRGRTFQCSHIFSGVVASGIVELFIEVPTGYNLHPDLSFSADNDLNVSLVTAASGTTGVALDVKNVNTNYSASTPQSTITHTPTGLGAETIVFSPEFHPASGVGSNVAIIGDAVEPVLGPGKHVYRAQNVSGVAAKINLKMIFYEEAIA